MKTLVVYLALAMLGPLAASYGAAPSDFESHPDPLGDYSAAVAKVAELRAAEVGLSPGAHTFLLTHGARTERAIVLIPGLNALPSSYDELAKRLFDRGYNVLSVALPYQGLEDRMTTRLAEVRYKDWIRSADAAVDIGHGLGRHLTVAGISLGGLITGWVAQQRHDVDRAVLISPGYTFKVWPEFLDAIMGSLFTVLPNMFRWEDDKLKADYPAYYGYPRFPTRAVVQVIRFHAGLKDMARESAPAAKDVVVVTNAGDGDLDNTGTDRVVANWRKRGAKITTHEFSKDLHVGHDVIDPRRPDAQIEAIYPVLLELIDKERR
jgi:alpha-beta hydrolase superfamily lysophospholipase